MVTRLLLLVLCLGVLSTVTGCYVEPTAYATSSDGGGTGNETRQYRKQWGRQDGEPYHPWERPTGHHAESMRSTWKICSGKVCSHAIDMLINLCAWSAILPRIARDLRKVYQRSHCPGAVTPMRRCPHQILGRM